MITSELVSDITDIGPYRAMWEGIYSSSEYEPSLSYEWSDALLKGHVQDSDKIYFVIFKNSDQVIGFLPLVIRHIRLLGQTLKVLFPISELYKTHSDFLVKNICIGTLHTLFATIDKNIDWHIFRMSRILNTNPLLHLLDKYAHQSNYRCHVSPEFPSYFIELPSCYADYLSLRSGKFRNYLKRMERRISEYGIVHIEKLEHKTDVARFVNQLIEIEKNSWKNDHGTSINKISRQAAFYLHLCQEAIALKRIHLVILHISGIPVAYNLGYIQHKTYYYLKTSFNKKYHEFSPASVLRGKLIQLLINEKISRIDFPGEPYEWEKQWADQYRWNYSFFLYNKRLKSNLYYLYRNLFKPRVTDLGKVNFYDARKHTSSD